jgi:hypothetical protein
VITDRELDAQLAGAAGVDDADLPALPEDFLSIVKGDASDDPASVIAARQLVADARDARGAARPRRRRPSRRATVRIGVALVALAAAWTTAVVVAPADRPARPADPIATPSGGATTPTGGIELVAAEAVTFPLSLDPAPEGLTPLFSRVGGTAYYGDQPLVFTADYSSGGRDRVLLRLFPEDPRGYGEDSGWSLDGEVAGTVPVDGAVAEVRRSDGYLTLLWQRPDGRWLQILGEGAYAETAAAAAVAASVVDRPQPVGLQFGLAPAGWSLGGYEESRSLDLVSDADPSQPPLRVSTQGLPGGGITLDTFFEDRALAGPLEPVTIQGTAARLALADGYETDPDTWLVAGQLRGGPIFLLLAPPILTKEQVLQIAEQISYTP